MIKSTFSTKLSSPKVDFALLLLRLAAGGLMITHGLPKLQMILSGEIQFGDPIGIGTNLSLYLTVFAEFFCAILIILGLATRLASIPLIICMVVAVFVVHAADPIGVKELGLFYLASYVALLFSGAGKFSVDEYLKK